MVRAVSCREVVQESILRNDLSSDSAQKLAETMVSSLLMGAGLKMNETLQVNIVGGDPNRIRNVMVVTDGDLAVRGMVGNPTFKMSSNRGELSVMDAFGDGGQLQVVRNHPDFKQPQVGIVQLRDADIALNLAMYMQESEQRVAAIITDCLVEGSLCRHALGVIVERLPGVSEDSIETSIANLGGVEKKGLRSYLTRSPDELAEIERSNTANGVAGEMFRDFEPVLERVLDDVMASMDEGGTLRWTKNPSFKCSCGVERVWRTLSILPRADIEAIVEDQEVVEVKCQFCGSEYSVSPGEIREKLLDAAVE
jgi:molecular chaperone Hsp33